MSIEKEIQKEHKKLTKEMESTKRKLDALEDVMEVFVWPKNPRITDSILDCMSKYGGCATYFSIYTCLQKKGIDIPRNKLSQLLTNFDKIFHNKETDKWEIKSPINDNSPSDSDRENPTSSEEAS